MVEVEGKKFDNIKQALLELAFCHYPVKVIIDDKDYVFDEFSKVEELLKSLEK